MNKYDLNFENIQSSKNEKYILIILNESLNENKSKSLTFVNLWKNGNYLI